MMTVEGLKDVEIIFKGGATFSFQVVNPSIQRTTLGGIEFSWDGYPEIDKGRTFEYLDRSEIAAVILTDRSGPLVH